MMRQSHSGCLFFLIAGWLCASVLAFAQTNQPPAKAPAIPDSERFFQAYSQAIEFLREKKPQRDQAVAAMDAVAQKINTSPWLEMAMLKHAELIEAKNNKAAMDTYFLLRSRAQNAPYFQSDAPYARVFRAALEGATANGINRIRINRIREALANYFARYGEYPESLAKLSILGYIEMENIQNMDSRNFRYTPTGVQLTPFISYKRYEPLESPPSEPFYVTVPSLEGTTEVSSVPLKYAAIIKMSGNSQPIRIVENQTLQGLLVCSIAPQGVILCSTDRILILPVLPVKP
jgi:hypothetical protein